MLTTDASGSVNQHLQYLPFGEDFISQRNSTWATPYTFSGKEKDSETGYSYFGARYYDSDLSLFLSVDAMASKYPSLSPYNYCGNNPVNLVDLDGNSFGPPDPFRKCSIFKSSAIGNLYRQIVHSLHIPRINLSTKTNTTYQISTDPILSTAIKEPSAGIGINNFIIQVNPPAGTSQISIDYNTYHEPDNIIVRDPSDNSKIAETGNVGENITKGSSIGSIILPLNTNQISISVIPQLDADGQSSTKYNVNLVFSAPSVYQKTTTKFLGIPIRSKYSRLGGLLEQRIMARNSDKNTYNDVPISDEYKNKTKK